MSWQYTGLPGPDDVLGAVGLNNLREAGRQDAVEREFNEETLTGVPPMISPGGVGSSVTLARSAGALVGFLGTRRQPSETGTGSPSEWTDDAVEAVTETGAGVVETVRHATGAGSSRGSSSGGGLGARLLSWVIDNPGQVVLVAVFLYLVPLLASSLDVLANLTEEG